MTLNLISRMQNSLVSANFGRKTVKRIEQTLAIEGVNRIIYTFDLQFV